MVGPFWWKVDPGTPGELPSTTDASDELFSTTLLYTDRDFPIAEGDHVALTQFAKCSVVLNEHGGWRAPLRAGATRSQSYYIIGA